MPGIETKNLPNYSLDQIEYFYNEGVISQDQWEAFCHIWRTASPRLSSERENYAKHPKDVGVLNELDEMLSVSDTIQCCRYA